ncbi:MAG: RidA family protein [Planctomycetota bacterium]
MSLTPINTDAASPPGGHYSQAVVAGGFVFISGMLPITPEGEKVLGSAAEQTRAALANFKAVIEAAGSSLDRVVKTTVYVSDIALWDEINAVYAEVFGEHRPARAVVPTRELHYGFVVVVEGVGVVI